MHLDEADADDEEGRGLAGVVLEVVVDDEGATGGAGVAGHHGADRPAHRPLEARQLHRRQQRRLRTRHLPHAWYTRDVL